MNTIYALIDPRWPNTIRYVGVTRQKLGVRLTAHLGLARTDCQWPISRWLRKLLAAGVRPVAIVLEVTDDRMREKFWMLHFFTEGMPLLNCAEVLGGDLCKTQEQRESIRQRMLGRQVSPETRAKMSAALKGRPGSAKPGRYLGTEESKRKISETLRGRKMPPEVNAKISATLKGRKKTPEHVAKVAAKRRGCKHSDETKAKLSAIARSRPVTPRKRQTHCRKGHPLPPVTGLRSCRECARLRAVAYYHADPEKYRARSREYDRAQAALRPPKTSRSKCSQGHELTPENIALVGTAKKRRCRLCLRAAKRASEARRYARKKAAKTNR